MDDTYGLPFISDRDILEHVSETLEKYRTSITLEQFNRNLIDPIKLTFDSKSYGLSPAETIEAECIRQIDKSNTNLIGYFHQNIFKYIEGWDVPEKGFDAINEERQWYCEIKNKHNTMNSSSSQKTYSKMQHTILHNDQATCYLVEIIAKKSADEPWAITLDQQRIAHNKIRRISVDKLYELISGDGAAFKKLCQALPKIIDDAQRQSTDRTQENTVLSELEAIEPDLLKSLYLFAFKHYGNFQDFEFDS